MTKIRPQEEVETVVASKADSRNPVYAHESPADEILSMIPGTW